MKNPNIVYLHAHDLGRWVQPYGFPVSTPHLMQFAREGVTFRNAFSTAPTCGPSRSSLLSGQYPHQVGMYGLPGPQGWEFKDYRQHLARQLKSNGYVTALAGCQHECDGRDLSPLDYDHILCASERPLKGQFYPDTVDRVEAFLATSHARPFFISIGIDEPHRNNLARPEIGVGDESARFSKTRYYDPHKLDSRYVAPPAHLPDTPDIRRDMASFHEGVRIMDEYMGRVFSALRHYGHAENTLVIVTTDHGAEFAGGKKTLSDQGLGVTLIMRGPGGFEGGKVVDGLVSQLDLYPTIMEVAGIAAPSWLEGTSLGGIARGEVESVRDAVFGEQTYHGSLEAMRSVRTRRYKLIRRLDPIGPKMRHDGPCTSFFENIGFYDRSIGLAEFYDLQLDPTESCNRVDDPSYADVLRRLDASLTAWMSRTGDPFLTNELPVPPHS